MSTPPGPRQWPLTGNSTAKVGPTIKNSFKKKSAGPGAGSSKGGRDLYAVRYNFWPQGLDTQKSGSFDISACKDDHGSISKVVLERPLANKDDVSVFEGVEKPMQTEYDCVLIWDELLQTLVLEKVESQINLTHMGQRPPTRRLPSNSPAATPEAPGSTSAAASPIKQEAEDSEEEVPIVKATQPTKRPMPFHPKPKPKLSAAPLQTPVSASSSVPSPVSTKPKARPLKRANPPPASPKRPPTPPKPFGLQLPTSGSRDLALPFAPARTASANPEPVSAPPVIQLQATEPDEEEEDDMEEVEPEALPYSPAANDVPAPTPDPLVGQPRGFSETFVMEEVEGDGDDDMEEVGVETLTGTVGGDDVMEETGGDDDEGFDFLAADLGGDGEDDDDDDDDMEPVGLDSAPAAPLPGDGPISLNAYAGGGGMEEDDYSSSDESD
ncbi:unnamed protein product [Peniophora sp. CBMAI 1063]|nr:unnamed protein product [Peniophora sp. CBMAI 1063]